MVRTETKIKVDLNKTEKILKKIVKCNVSNIIIKTYLQFARSIERPADNHPLENTTKIKKAQLWHSKT